jgi:hypothetical protein
MWKKSRPPAAKDSLTKEIPIFVLVILRKAKDLLSFAASNELSATTH